MKKLILCCILGLVSLNANELKCDSKKALVEFFATYDSEEFDNEAKKALMAENAASFGAYSDVKIIGNTLHFIQGKFGDTDVVFKDFKQISVAADTITCEVTSANVEEYDDNGNIAKTDKGEKIKFVIDKNYKVKILK